MNKHLDSIHNAATNNALKKASINALNVIGFSTWLYASNNPYSLLNFPAIISCGYSNTWLMTYLSKRYQMVDPIVSHCRTHTEPLFWDAATGWDGSDQKVQEFMADVKKHGYASGVAFALKCEENISGLLNIISEKPLHKERDRYATALPQLQQIGQALHKKMAVMLKKPVFRK